VATKIRHELVVVPVERCEALQREIEELRQAHSRAKEIAFQALPEFYRSLPAWQTLARHRLPGGRRSWSRDGAAVNIVAGLAARTGFDWSWLESMAHLLDPDVASSAATELAALVAASDGPQAVVMRGLSRIVPLSDEKQRALAPIVAAELATPDGEDHGEPGELVELLRNLAAALHDAASRGDGLLYLNYRSDLV
jgi:hypothetical protein